jgi:hypothetical protein
MTPAQIIAAIDDYCAENDCSLRIFSEMVGQRFGLTPEAAARRINEARRTGRMTDDYIDRIAVVLDLHEVDTSPIQPGLDAYCPCCREIQPSRADGTCLWCDAQTGGNSVPNVVDRLDGKRKQARSRNAGTPYLCTEEQLLEVRRLYLTGLSMRAACESVQPGTGYANSNAMAMSMYSLFEQRGWNRRSQAQATAARNYRHGKNRDPAHRRAMRRKQGYVRGVRCKGVKRNAPGKDKPCQMYAMTDSEYCRAHDPRYREEHHAHMQSIRDRVGHS